MNKTCALTSSSLTISFLDNFSEYTQTLVAIIDHEKLSDLNYNETGSTDQTNYSDILIKIVIDLAKKGLKNGLKIIALGIKEEGPDTLKGFPNIEYVKLPDIFVKSAINVFARDLFYFTKSNEKSVIVNFKPDREWVLPHIALRWDALKVNIKFQESYVGGQIQITQNKKNQTVLLLGEGELYRESEASAYNSVHRNCVNETFYEEEFYRALCNMYDVSKGVIVLQTPVVEREEYKGSYPEVILQYISEKCKLQPRYLQYYENMDKLYYHLDMHVICGPDGHVIINSMRLAVNLILDELKKGQDLPRYFKEKNLSYVRRFLMDIADVYETVDQKIKETLEEAGFEVHMAPLMICTPGGEIAMSMANGLPGLTREGTRVYYVAEPSNTIEKRMLQEFKKTVNKIFPLEILEIKYAHVMMQKTLSSLHCAFTPASVYP